MYLWIIAGGIEMIDNIVSNALIAFYETIKDNTECAEDNQQYVAFVKGATAMTESLLNLYRDLYSNESSEMCDSNKLN